MTARGLRFRLFLGAAIWVSLALVIAGSAIAWLFVANVEATARRDLEAELSRLAALIDPLTVEPALTASMPDPRYETPFSGLYWQITGEDGTALRSRSLWDFTLSAIPGAPADGTIRFGVIEGPDGQSLTAIQRSLRFATESGGRRFSVILAEDRAVIDASIARFGLDLVLAMIVLGVVLLIAAFLQVELGLRPLKTLREGVERIRRGRAARLDESYPEEVLPLVAEVNDLLDSQTASLEFARARAADLAHGLKTPLAVLSNSAADLAARGETETAATLEELAEDMTDRIDYQLRLSRLSLRSHNQIFSADLSEALHRSINVLGKTRAGERIAFSLDIGVDLIVDIDPHDLIELVGVVLENAVKWADSLIVVAVHSEGPMAILEIADDGPGLAPEKIRQITQRGQRLDESRPGSGLGLAIATEIIEMNRGRIAFSASSIGGLLVRIELPISPQRESDRASR